MGYIRIALGATTRTVSSVVNDAVVEFAAATGNWGTITHVALFDAVSGGNFLGSAALTEPKIIVIDKIARFPAGAIEVTLT